MKAPLKKNLIIGTAVLLIVLLYFFVDARTHAFPKCPFYSVFHLYCPGCGSQRALSALLHGNITDALHDNVLMVVFLPLLLYSAFVNVLSNGSRSALLFYDLWFVRTVLIVVILFWIFRNIPSYPFSALSPIN